MESMSGMATATSAAAAATSAAASMDMGMDMGGDCKISMLWNWDVIDACFISSSWRITSKGMFAGSCIGVVLLVISLEFLRRLSKEYDRYILRQFQRSRLPQPSFATKTVDGGKLSATASSQSINDNRAILAANATFRPNILQQMVRATLHMVQFGVAYFVMLLAMYYNGYFIISIIIGAWLGAFVFSWETVDCSASKEEATVCCG